MSDHWFFCRELAADVITLRGDEAHHALAVRRLRKDDAVTLFDGHGAVASGRVLELVPRGSTLTVRIVARTVQNNTPTLHLGCAIAKGDRQALLLDMATQLGISDYTPLVCERSVVKSTDASATRWQRICLEACKQSRRAYLPQLHDASDIPGFVTAAVARGESVWMAHPSGTAPATLPRGEVHAVLIGPEGGFSDDEVDRAVDAGVSLVNLGSGILRIETAAIALLAFLSLGRS